MSTKQVDDGNDSNDRASLAFELVENAPFNVMCADPELRITYMNPSLEETLRSFEQHLRVSVDNVIGASMDVFFAAHHQRLLQLGETSGAPFTTRIHLGNETAEVVVRAMYGQSGEYLGPMAMWNLVTEDDELRTLSLDALTKLSAMNQSVAMLELDLDGAVLSANDIALGLLELTAGEIAGMNHRDLCSDDALWATLKHGEQARGEVRMTAKGGRAVWMTASYQMVPGPDGRPASVMITAVDVTPYVRRCSRSERLRSDLARAARRVAASTKALDSACRPVSAARDAHEASLVRETVTQHVKQAAESLHSVARRSNLAALNTMIQSRRAPGPESGLADMAEQLKQLSREALAAADEITRRLASLDGDPLGGSESREALEDLLYDVETLANATTKSVDDC